MGWDENTHAELERLAAAGLSATAIAETLGKSKGSVIGRCWRKGVRLRGPSPFSAGYTHSDATRLRLSEQAKRRWMMFGAGDFGK